MKMPNTFHIVFDENRHRLQQPQRDTPTQRRSLGEIDEILQTKGQGDALGELYVDVVGGGLGVVIGFESDLAVANVALAGEFDAPF
jgi:hypothetical protein